MVTASTSRAVLPVPDAHQPRPGLLAYDAHDPEASYPPIRHIRPPADAPNVVVVLLDDGLRRVERVRRCDRHAGGRRQWLAADRMRPSGGCGP